MSAAYGEPVNLGDLGETESRIRARWAQWSEVGMLIKVEAVSYAALRWADPFSDEREWYSTEPRLEAFGIAVAKWTPCGATLKHDFSGSRPRWVNLEPGAKQWASRTLSEAIEQFRKRRERQIWVLGRKLDRARRELKLCSPSTLQIPIA